MIYEELIKLNINSEHAVKLQLFLANNDEWDHQKLQELYSLITHIRAGDDSMVIPFVTNRTDFTKSQKHEFLSILEKLRYDL